MRNKKEIMDSAESAGSTNFMEMELIEVLIDIRDILQSLKSDKKK